MHCVPKNLKIGNNYIDLNFEHFEIFEYIVSYLGTLFVQEYFLSNALLSLKKKYFLNYSFYQKVKKTKITPYEKCLTFCKKKNSLSNALQRFNKKYILIYSFYQKV